MQIITYKCDRCGRESKDASGVRRLTLSFPYIFQAPDTEPMEEDLCSDCIADILRYARNQKEEPELMESERIGEVETIEEETYEEEPEAKEAPIEPEETAPEKPEKTVEADTPKKRVRIDKEEMWRLYMSGVSIYNIAERLGCKISTVHTILSRMRKERFQSKEEE